MVRGPGKFEPRLVKLGVESRGQVAVLQGIKAGEEVVTSAQFLVDSESKLREATAKMMESLKGQETGESGTSTDESMDHADSEMKDHQNMKMTTEQGDPEMLEKSNQGEHKHD